MNPVFRLALVVYSKLLNNLDENSITEKDVNTAIDYGYTYEPGVTPIHLLKYPRMIELCLKQEIISKEEFIYLLEHDYFKNIDDLYDFYIIDKIVVHEMGVEEVIKTKKINIDDEEFKDLTIEFVRKNLAQPSSHIEYFVKREELIYDYLDLYPSSIKNIEYDFKDNARLYKICKKHQIPFNEIKNIKDKKALLYEWMKDDPKVLLDPTLEYKYYNDSNIIAFVEDCLKDGRLTIDELVNVPIGYKTPILIKILNNDFSKIELLTNAAQQEEILKIFLNKLPDSIDYLYTVSKLFEYENNNSIVNDIRDKIIELGLKVGPCLWKKIYNDKEVMLPSIQANPSILTELSNTNFTGDERLTKDEEELLATIIKDKNLIFHTIIPLFYNYSKIFLAALRNNPYIIDTIINNNYYLILSDEIDEIIDILEETGYQISLSTPGQLYNHPKFFVNQLKKNISIVNNPLFSMYNNQYEEDTIEIYNIIISSEIELTKDLVKRLYNPLIYIVALKRGIVKLSEVNIDIENLNEKNIYYDSLIKYIQANYSKEELKRLNLETPIANHYYSNNKEEKEILFILQKNFSYCTEITNTQFSSSSLKEIAKIYLLNREANLKYYETCDFIKNNIYINLYENIYYGTPFQDAEKMYNLPDEYSSDIADIYIQELKTNKKEVNKKLAYLLFKNFEKAKFVFENNPQLLGYYNGKFGGREVSNYIIKKFKEGSYIPSEETDNYVCYLLLEQIVDSPIHFDYEDELIEIGIKYIFNNNSYINSNVFIKALTSGKITLSDYLPYYLEKLVNQLEPQVLRKIILMHPENVVVLEATSLKPELSSLKDDPSIIDIYNRIPEFKKIKEDRKNAKVVKRISSNPQETIYKKSFYEQYLSDDEYTYYHENLFKEVKNKKVNLTNININLLIFSDKEYSSIDIEAIDYLSLNESEYFNMIAQIIFASITNKDLLIQYKDRISHETKILLLKEIDNIPYNTFVLLVDDIKDEEARDLIAKGAYLTTKQLLYLFDNKHITSNERIIEKYRDNDLILNLLEKDINNYKLISLDYIIKKENEQKLYELFKKSNLNNPYIHPFFSKCSLISNEYRNRTFAISEELLEAYSKREYNDTEILQITGCSSITQLIITACKISPQYVKYFSRKKLNNEEVVNFLLEQDLKYDISIDLFLLEQPKLLRKVLETDFDNTIRGLGNTLLDEKKLDYMIRAYNIALSEKIEPEEVVELCIKNNYVLSVDSPDKLKSNKDVIINSLKNNINSIIYCNRYVEFSGSEKQEIREMIIKNNIHYYDFIFPFLLNDIPYLTREIDFNPLIVNEISDAYFDDKTYLAVINIIKENIKNNRYKFSTATPEWILKEREMLISAIKECPELLDKYPHIKLTLSEYKELYDKGINIKNNPYELLNTIIKNYKEVDSYTFDPNIVYPTKLVYQLIDLLIENNYSVSYKTSPILMTKKMIYYALKNNMELQPSYIRKFISFENLYETKDIDLFKKLIKEGYGGAFKPYIDAWGLDKALEIIACVGSYISKVEYDSSHNIESIRDTILEKSEDYHTIIDILIRTNYDFTEEEIKNGIPTKGYQTVQVSDNKLLFLHLIRKNPRYITLYTGENESVYEEATKYGFKYTIEDYHNIPAFQKSDYVTRIMIDIDPSTIEYYTGSNHLIFQKAFNNGYKVTKEKMSTVKTFQLQPVMLLAAMQDDIESIYYYRGNSKSLENIFEIIDKDGKRIIPEPKNIEKLEFMHNNQKLMIKAINYDINNVYYCKDITINNIFDITDSKGNKLIPEPKNIERINFIRKNPNLILRALEYDINNITMYTGDFTEEIEYFIIKKTDSKGQKLDLSYESLSKLPVLSKSLAIFKLAIERDPNNLVLFTGESNEELTNLAIAKGFVPTKEMLENSSSLSSNEYIYKYIIKQGMYDLLIYYTGNNSSMIQSVYKGLLGDKYDSVITDEKVLKRYITAWISFNDITMHKHLMSFLNKECVDAFASIDFDFYLVLKYGINNSKITELINIIDNGKIKEYCDFYKLVKDKYITFDNNAFGVDMFLKTARFYNRYPALAKDIMTHELDDAMVAELISLINEKNSFSSLNNVEELKQVSTNRVVNVKLALESCKSSAEIKDLILKYVFDMNYEEFIHILTNYINFDTLDKILVKAHETNNEELIEEATSLKILLQMIEETVHATDDFDTLKQLLLTFLENFEEVNKVRSLYYNLKERIRNIYELDAIVTLTDMDEAKKFLRPKKNPNFPDVIELENQEYAIYAHVVSNTDLEDFVNARFNGRVTICVSPISNIGKKLFSEKGIILGYTKVPRGSFIGSSNNSMHSNSYIQNNDYEPKEDNYYHLEIKDSSAITPGSYPETLLYREGLVPTCIIIRGQEPSLEEREAQKKFATLGLDLPFVHTQAIGDIATISGKEVQIIASEKTEQSVISEEKIDIGEYNPELAKLKEIRKKIIKIKEKIAALNIKQDEVYDIIKLSIGGSHDMYKCHVKGKKGVFYLKPGVRKDGEAIDPYRSEAMEAAYNIQTIANPENAVFASTIQVPGYKIGVPDESMVTCSIIEVIPDATNYSGWCNSSTAQLSSREVSSFIQECISDYLLFSYDTKGENFLRDKFGNTYGIDKEQALKYILATQFAEQDQETGEYTFNTSFGLHNSRMCDFNNCGSGLLYIKLFEAIKMGRIELTDENIAAAIKAIERVEAINDEKYKNIFKKFIDSFIDGEPIRKKIEFYINKGLSEEEAKNRVKNDLYASLLARKHNLREEFISYFIEILDSYSEIKGVDVTEWKNKLNNKQKTI